MPISAFRILRTLPRETSFDLVAQAKLQLPPGLHTIEVDLLKARGCCVRVSRDWKEFYENRRYGILSPIFVGQMVLLLNRRRGCLFLRLSILAFVLDVPPTLRIERGSA